MTKNKFFKKKKKKFWNKNFFFLVMKFMKYTFSTIFLNHVERTNQSENLEAESFSISPQKEIAFNTTVIEKYLKERNNLYDFLYLGESEELNVI